MDEVKKWDEIFDYDHDTGELRWKVKPCDKVRCGDIAGSKSNKGYLQVGYKGKQYRAHRIVYEMVHGSIPVGMQIDHKNRVKDDNRLENLRLATNLENSRNGSMSSNNTSGSTGVFWDKGTGKWRASLCLSGKHFHLGIFTHKPDAIDARLAAEKLYYGAFAPSLVKGFA